MKELVNKTAIGTTVRYRGTPCIVLKHRADGTLLLMAEPDMFRFGATNNFAFSDLRCSLDRKVLDRVTQGHRDEVIPRMVDLTALNGSREYGTVKCRMAPLDLDELRKYRDIIPFLVDYEWSVTPWTTDDSFLDGRQMVLSVSDTGMITRARSTGISPCRPAFLVPPKLEVEVRGQ